VDTWESQPIFSGQSPEQRAAQREIRRSHSASGLIVSLRATGLGVMPCLENALGRADIPIDLLVGERDSKFVALAESVASSLPRPRLELVSGAGHNLLIERPDVVVRAIARGART
jgi:2-succinyl-6-hydroxy-2,4-cyclohexadiene-1-carboxylate synthase